MFPITFCFFTSILLKEIVLSKNLVIDNFVYKSNFSDNFDKNKNVLRTNIVNENILLSITFYTKIFFL